MYKKAIVTGGQGFIGTNLINYLLKKKIKVLSIDKISYASNLINTNKKGFILKKLDLSNFNDCKKAIFKFKPEIIFHLAAESHVDNSIIDSDPFIKSNILGTFNLLKIVQKFNQNKINKIKIINVSTDEVYGSIKKGYFSEKSKFYPNSPYSASKASADMLARAWFKTFQLPIITTNCSNNFGPFQHDEKLIPKIIFNLLKKKKIPIYGDGKNMRDWIYVLDHVEALFHISKKGKVGETYNIGSYNVLKNTDIVRKIIKIHNHHQKLNLKFEKVVKFVKDRKGHDFRYAIDSTKLNKIYKINNSKKIFNQNLINTYNWYLNKL